MTTEPNNEQARELSEKELEGIAGGEKSDKGLDTVDEFKIDRKIDVLDEAVR